MNLTSPDDLDSKQARSWCLEVLIAKYVSITTHTTSCAIFSWPQCSHLLAAEQSSPGSTSSAIISCAK